MAKEPKIEASSAGGDKVVSARVRRELVPYSDMQISRLEAAGKFPKRIRLGPGRVGWLFSEIQDWIAARKAERDAAAKADQ